MKRNIGIVVLLIISMVTFHTTQAQLTEEVSKKTPDMPGFIQMDFGYNIARDDDEQSWFRSRSFALYYGQTFNIGKNIQFIPKLGWSSEKYTVKPSAFSDVKLPEIDTTIVFDLRKVALSVNYLELPLEFQYNFSGNDKKGLFIALGVSGGLKIENHLKIKFVDNQGEKYKFKLKSDLSMSSYRYGGIVRLGYRSVSLFYKIYVNDVFDKYSSRQSTVGITIRGL